VTVPTTAAPPNRIQLRALFPTVDGGRYPVKRCVGDVVHVGCDVFRDGHDLLRTVVRWRGPGDEDWQEAEMLAVDAHYKGVRWEGHFPVDRQGRWEYTVQSWTDHFATWRDELRRKVEGAQADLSGELSEGLLLLQAAHDRAPEGEDRARIARAIALITDPGTADGVRHGVALDEHLAAAVERHAERDDPTELDQPLPLEVDRLRARFGSWYELFPRSFGGLKGVEAQLPRLAELGFDILYLPPIHPI
jgi:starch synthase (maltosyl-transferring)